MVGFSHHHSPLVAAKSEQPLSLRTLDDVDKILANVR